jgi:dTDP-4-amino-4,6-dideoxygalactose transaminase
MGSHPNPPRLTKNDKPDQLVKIILGTIDKIKKFCVSEGIEYRPIIGGNLLKQTAFKKYAKTGYYANAEILNQNGLYVGLHYGVTAKQINKFVNTINKI